jgi:hypothetical protein
MTSQKKAPAKKTTQATAKPKRDRKTGRITQGVAQDTNKNGTAGAPTKFKDEYCEAMIAFFSGQKYERVIIEQETKTTKQGRSERVKYRYVPKDLPQLEAYARNIGVTFQTLYNWAHEKDDKGNIKRPEFFDAYNVCKQLQKEFLIDNGLMGNYPPASFIFVAKNITDMRDTKDIKLKSEDDIGGVSDAELEEALFD